MKIQKIVFQFADDGKITWVPAGKDAPVCLFMTSVYFGRRYKWKVYARINNYVHEWHTFVGPTQAAAKRFYKQAKTDNV